MSLCVVMFLSDVDDKDHNTDFVIRSDICGNCIENNFPFNHLSDDNHFIKCLTECRVTLPQADGTHRNDTEFDPFDFSNADIISPLFNVDPDINHSNISRQQNSLIKQLLIEQLL